MPTNADYQKIAIACSNLGIDRKQLLADRYKVGSAKDLSNAQLWDLYAHFNRLGWRPKRKKGNTQKYEEPIQRKVQAMWIELHKTGVIRNRSDHALQQFVKKNTGVENLKWCGKQECSNLIEALKAMAKREKIDVE